MASYAPPIKNHPVFNTADFKGKEEGIEGDVLEIAPPLINNGVAYLKSDKKLHTEATFVYDDVNNYVGIGTAIPSRPLHVVGNSFLDGNLGVGTNSIRSAVSITPNSVGAKITLYDGLNEGVTSLVNHYGWGVSGGALNYHVEVAAASHDFYSTGKNGDGTHLMRIKGDGTVGIGTKFGTSKFNVVGTSSLAGNLAVVGNTSLTDGNLTLMNGKMAIGTTTPDANSILTIAGSSKLEGSLFLNGKLDFSGSTSSPQMILKSLQFPSLITTGALDDCSLPLEYPVCIQAINNTNNITRAAIAFSGSSNSIKAPEACITYTKLADTPARGKLDINMVDWVNQKSAVVSFQSDRVLLNKKVGISQSNPLSELHVTGDGIVSSKLSIGTNAVPSTYRLTFPTSAEPKICLSAGSGSTMYGLGVGSNSLNYNVPSSANNHVFKQGGNNDDGTLLAQIKGTGQLLLGNTTTPYGKMTFDNTLENKITLSCTDTTSQFGMGLSLSTNSSKGNDNTTWRQNYNFNTNNDSHETEYVFYSGGLNGLTSGAVQLMKIHYSNGTNQPCVLISSTKGRSSYQLELEKDSAGKPGYGGFWANSSDQRIKEDIQEADLNRCYDVVKLLPLMRFKFKEGIYKPEQINGDTYGLGFIAQDAQKYFPKSVQQTNQHSLDDCLSLNQDQIFKAMYGAVQLLQIHCEEQLQMIHSLQTEMSELKKLVF